MDSDQLKNEKRNDLDDSSASRAITNAIREQTPQPPRNPDEAVYADTDLNPNQEDQKSAHEGD